MDRLLPDYSKWLEIGPIPNVELEINAKYIAGSSLSNLNWCDEPDRLRKYAITVLGLLRHQPLEQGTMADADRLRSELMGQALRYAKEINPETSEWPRTFPWTLLSSKGR